MAQWLGKDHDCNYSDFYKTCSTIRSFQAEEDVMMST